jgi:hypothetical protein
MPKTNHGALTAASKARSAVPRAFAPASMTKRQAVVAARKPNAVLNSLKHVGQSTRAHSHILFGVGMAISRPSKTLFRSAVPCTDPPASVHLDEKPTRTLAGNGLRVHQQTAAAGPPFPPAVSTAIRLITCNHPQLCRRAQSPRTTDIYERMVERAGLVSPRQEYASTKQSG